MQHPHVFDISKIYSSIATQEKDDIHNSQNVIFIQLLKMARNCNGNYVYDNVVIHIKEKC
jgi:hypothetical protein